MSLSEATEGDIASVSKQLGRPARDIVAIAARCICGNPIVVQTKPRLEDGTPFPTVYYLTLPAATSAISTLEATGLMAELQQRLLKEPDLAEQYSLAHQSYLADRNLLGEVEEIRDISAGGMPQRVKCLHALAAHSLAKGAGVNPIGDIALEMCSWKQNRCQCAE
ncbi:MAG: DUF501 domain-containing protein [Actinomycetota bacterium]